MLASARVVSATLDLKEPVFEQPIPRSISRDGPVLLWALAWHLEVWVLRDVDFRREIHFPLKGFREASEQVSEVMAELLVGEEPCSHL